MNSLHKPDFIKVAVVGETEVGKTSLISRWCEDVFPRFDQIKSTIGAAFVTKEHAIADSSITMQIWDFAGQSHFADVMNHLIRGAKSGLLVFDLSKPSTMDTLENFWIPTINKILRIDLKTLDKNAFILVGNKLDLVNEEDELFTILNEVEQFCEKYNNLDYVSVSAKTGENINKLKELVDEKIKLVMF